MTTKSQELASFINIKDDLESDLMFTYNEEGSSGLTFAYTGGRISDKEGSGGDASKTLTVSAGSVVLPTAAGTNFVYVDAATGDVSAVDSSDTNTTPSINNSRNRINLFEVATDGGAITSVTRLLSPHTYVHFYSRTTPPYVVGGDLSIDSGDPDHDVELGLTILPYSSGVPVSGTKQIDAVWTEGNDVGGMNSAEHPVSADTKYFIFGAADVNKSNGEWGFDTDFLGSNLLADFNPAGWSNSIERIGACRTDASANLQSVWKIDPAGARAILDVFDISTNTTSITLSAAGILESFDRYEIVFQDVVTSTDAVDLRVRMGSTSPAPAAYDWEAVYVSGGTTTDTSGTSDTRIRFLGADTMGNDTGGSTSGTITLSAPTSASLFTNLSWDLNYYDVNTRAGRAYGSGLRAAAETTVLFEISFEKAGAQVVNGIASGKFKLYGIR